MNQITKEQLVFEINEAILTFNDFVNIKFSEYLKETSDIEYLEILQSPLVSHICAIPLTGEDVCKVTFDESGLLRTYGDQKDAQHIFQGPNVYGILSVRLSSNSQGPDIQSVKTLAKYHVEANASEGYKITKLVSQ